MRWDFGWIEIYTYFPNNIFSTRFLLSTVRGGKVSEDSSFTTITATSIPLLKKFDKIRYQIVRSGISRKREFLIEITAIISNIEY